MRFPRNAKIFRGQLDAAPFAGVSFLLLIFLLLSSKLAFTPGIRIDLPEVEYKLPGTANPTVVVAIDSAGQLYYESKEITEQRLYERLKLVRQQSDVPLTLEVLADKSGKQEAIFRVLAMATEIGFLEVSWKARPKLAPVPGRQPLP